MVLQKAVGGEMHSLQCTQVSFLMITAGLHKRACSATTLSYFINNGKEARLSTMVLIKLTVTSIFATDL